MAKNTDKITIKIEGENWEKALDKVFNKKRKEVKIDGFRKGCVPKDVYYEKVGIESLYMDAINEVIETAYQDALNESEIKPVIEPNIDVTDISKDSVTFVITLTGKPEVTLGTYKNLKIKKDEATVSKEEVAHEIEHLRSEFAEIKVKEDGVVENGDTAVIDFKGFVDGEELDGGSGANYPLEIGSHTFIPGFEEGIVGMNVDENKTLNLTFPKDYAKDLAGKDVTFEVTLREIKTRILPLIDEAFFEDLGYDKVTNQEELEKEVEKVLMDQKQHDIDDKYIDEVLTKAADNMKVELSEEIIDDEVHRMLDQFKEQLKTQGLKLEQYFEFTKSTMEDLHKQMEPEATRRIKYRYLLEAVAEAENITVTDEEALKDAEEMAKNYGITKEELINAFGSMEVVKYDAKMRKTLEFLKNN